MKMPYIGVFIVHDLGHCYVCNNIRRMRRGDDLLKITCARSTKEARDFIKEAVA
jgi:hypothetical protein